MPPAALSCLVLSLAHLCGALHYPHTGNEICNLKGGLCLPSNGSVCHPVDAECDEGNVCCKEIPAPLERTATCSSATHDDLWTDVNGDSGIISVWSKDNYENNLYCNWLITVDAGKVILIEWTAFELEGSFPQCRYDYVEIFDENLQLLGQRFCDDKVMPPSLTSSCNQVFVSFHTDASIVRRGFSLSYSSVAPTTACGVVNRQIRIVGGQETLVHEYPWQVGLISYSGSRPWCGGSILSRRWILTAAHCLPGVTLTNTQVLVGEHDWSTSGETGFTTVVDIEQVVSHPDFDKTTYDNDVGLLKLNSELTFTQANRVAPVCLPPVGTQDRFEDVDAIVSGWGKLTWGGSQPDVLNDVTVPTMSNTQCQQSYGSLTPITNNMICAGVPEGGKDSCQGDSGGPMVTEADDGHMIQIGVVSSGYGCALPGYPGVYARVSNYITWILSHVDDMGCQSSTQGRN